MLIRLTNPSRGSNFESGQLIRVGDKEGANLVAEGYGVQADESEVQKFEPPHRQQPAPRRGNPFMMPPVHLCGCGFVAKDAEELEHHKMQCD